MHHDLFLCIQHNYDFGLMNSSSVVSLKHYTFMKFKIPIHHEDRCEEFSQGEKENGLQTLTSIENMIKSILQQQLGLLSSSTYHSKAIL